MSAFTTRVTKRTDDINYQWEKSDQFWAPLNLPERFDDSNFTVSDLPSVYRGVEMERPKVMFGFHR